MMVILFTKTELKPRAFLQNPGFMFGECYTWVSGLDLGLESTDLLQNKDIFRHLQYVQ